MLINPKNVSISKYKWKIKILKIPSSISIGIDSSNKSMINGYFSNLCSAAHSFYALELTPEWNVSFVSNEPVTYSNSGEICYEGDIITMELDVAHETLRFYRNGKDIGNFPGKINMNKQYHLAIAFLAEGQCELLEYQEKYH